MADTFEPNGTYRLIALYKVEGTSVDRPDNEKRTDMIRITRI